MARDRERPTRVSVVVPVHNAADVLPDQLDALVGQQFAGDFEVVIADNGSTDDLAAAVAPYADRLDVRVVPAHERRGVSHARNAGCRAARGDLIAICDADDVVTPGWLEAFVAASPTGDLLGGTLELELLNAPRAVRWRDIFPRSLNVSLRFLPFPQGCNVALWRDVFEATGGWDEDLVAGGDDADFAWRAQLSGSTLTLVDDALVHYRVRDSLTATMRQTVAYAEARGALLRRFRSHGARGSTPREVLKRVVWLATRVWYLAMPWSWRQGRWLVKAASLWGGVRGSVRHRVWAV